MLSPFWWQSQVLSQRQATMKRLLEINRATITQTLQIRNLSCFCLTISLKFYSLENNFFDNKKFEWKNKNFVKSFIGWIWSQRFWGNFTISGKAIFCKMIMLFWVLIDPFSASEWIREFCVLFQSARIWMKIFSPFWNRLGFLLILSIDFGI